MHAAAFEPSDFQLFAGAEGWGLHGPVIRHYDNLCVICTSETTRLVTDGGTEYVLPGVVWPTQYSALMWLNNALPQRSSPLAHWLDIIGFKHL